MTDYDKLKCQSQTFIVYFRHNIYTNFTQSQQDSKNGAWVWVLNVIDFD